jgi:hypothetical protein
MHTPSSSGTEESLHPHGRHGDHTSGACRRKGSHYLVAVELAWSVRVWNVALPVLAVWPQGRCTASGAGRVGEGTCGMAIAPASRVVLDVQGVGQNCATGNVDVLHRHRPLNDVMNLLPRMPLAGNRWRSACTSAQACPQTRFPIETTQPPRQSSQPSLPPMRHPHDNAAKAAWYLLETGSKFAACLHCGVRLFFKALAPTSLDRVIPILIPRKPGN